MPKEDYQNTQVPSFAPHRPDGTTAEPSAAAYLGGYLDVDHEEAHHCRGKQCLGDGPVGGDSGPGKACAWVSHR